MADAYEVNFDGLVGPTHNYAGLSPGNIASIKHRHLASSPRDAALEGLAKMKSLHDLGLKQAVLPPQERPHIPSLRALGFYGDDAQVLARAARETPELLAGVSSASAMWAANAATVSPSADTADEKVHVTPANLLTQFHRAFEAAQTTALLRRIFADTARFVVHDPLPAARHFADEGAANHTRLCGAIGNAGLEIFTYGNSFFRPAEQGPLQYPARHTLEAAQAIARRHGLDISRTLFVRQSPEAIDAGVFHNDVISVGAGNVFFFHEKAFVEGAAALAALRKSFITCCGRELALLQVSETRLSLREAVDTYLFNSQLVELPQGGMLVLAACECEENIITRDLLRELVEDDANPISQVVYQDLRQSMYNGGGPACLRLRIVLTESELAAMHSGVLLTEDLYAQLVDWVTRHYRERLAEEDLADPNLLMESRRALDELSGILSLPGLYEFQREPG